MAETLSVLVVDGEARSLLSIGALFDSLAIVYKRNTTGANVSAQVASMRPDLVLIDRNLPDADPVCICDSIRSNPSTAKIPVVLMGEGLAAKCRTAFCSDFFFACIDKPLVRKQIMGVLACITWHQRSGAVNS